MSLKLISPQVLPPLDEDFRPAILANQNFQREVESVGVRIMIGVERSGGEVSLFETKVYPEGHPNFESNFQYIERIVKFLLWQRGGHTLHVVGSPKIAEYLKKAYSRQGSQKFDFDLLVHLDGMVVLCPVIFGVAYAFCKLQDKFMKGGIRSEEADEIEGLDLPEMGMLAYPEFMGSHLPGLEDQQVADPGGTELNV